MIVLPLRAQSPALAISGATLIDGTGGPAVPDALVVVAEGKITAAGPRASVRVPPDATVIDGKGKYVLPGLVDPNVHLSLYGGTADRDETLARYHPRQREIVLEAAQPGERLRSACGPGRAVSQLRRPPDGGARRPPARSRVPRRARAAVPGWSGC